MRGAPGQPGRDRKRVGFGETDSIVNEYGSQERGVSPDTRELMSDIMGGLGPSAAHDRRSMAGEAIAALDAYSFPSHGSASQGHDAFAMQDDLLAAEDAGSFSAKAHERKSTAGAAIDAALDFVSHPAQNPTTTPSTHQDVSVSQGHRRSLAELTKDAGPDRRSVAATAIDRAADFVNHDVSTSQDPGRSLTRSATELSSPKAHEQRKSAATLAIDAALDWQTMSQARHAEKAHARRSTIHLAGSSSVDEVVAADFKRPERRSLADQAISEAAASVAQRALGTHARKEVNSMVQSKRSKQDQQKEAELLIEDLHREAKVRENQLKSVRLDMELAEDKIVTLKRQLLSIKRATWRKFFSITHQTVFEEWRVLIQRQQNDIALEHLQTESLNDLRDKADRMMRVVGLMSSGANVIERCFTAWKMSKFSTPMEREMQERQNELQTVEGELATITARTQQLQNTLQQRQQEVDAQQSLVNEEVQKKNTLEEEWRLAEIASEELIASHRAACALEVSRKQEEAIKSEAYLHDLKRQARAYIGANGEVDPRSVVLAIARKVMPLAGHADTQVALRDLLNATGGNALKVGLEGDFLEESSQYPLARPPLIPANFRFDKEGREYRAAKSNKPLARLVAQDPGGLVAALALSVIHDLETRQSIDAQKRAEEQEQLMPPAEGQSLFSTLRSEDLTATDDPRHFEDGTTAARPQYRLIGRQRLDRQHSAPALPGQLGQQPTQQGGQPTYFSVPQLGHGPTSLVDLPRPPSPPKGLEVGNLQPPFQPPSWPMPQESKGKGKGSWPVTGTPPAGPFQPPVQPPFQPSFQPPFQPPSQSPSQQPSQPLNRSPHIGSVSQNGNLPVPFQPPTPPLNGTPPVGNVLTDTHLAALAMQSQFRSPSEPMSGTHFVSNVPRTNTTESVNVFRYSLVPPVHPQLQAPFQPPSQSLNGTPTIGTERTIPPTTSFTRPPE